MSPAEWRAEVHRLMRERYGLDPVEFEDLIHPDEEYGAVTPEVWCDWYAEKYDLDRIDIDPWGNKRPS